MNCTNCGQKNRKDSKYCRYCGGKLAVANESRMAPAKSQKGEITIKVPNLLEIFNIKRSSPKAVGIVIAIIILSVTSVLAAPKVDDYLEVRGAIKNAKELSESGDYQGALDILSGTDDKWAFEFQMLEMSDLETALGAYLEFDEKYGEALILEEEGDLKDARDLLREIGADYPKYEEIETKLDELSLAIEGELEAEADAARAARAAAERRAASEAAAKQQAEADARVAADARARAEAEARDAEYRRQQEEQERVEQVRRSFLNQLVGLYNSYSTAVDYMLEAVDDYSNGDDLVALAVLGQADALLLEVHGNATDLKNRFTGLPSSYEAAAGNMESAAYFARKAVTEMSSTIAYGTSYSGDAGERADSHSDKVENFLDGQGY